MATVRRNFSANQGITAESGDIHIKGGNSLKIDDGSANAITLSAPTAVDAAYELKLPENAGSANDVLQVDGSGNLSFASLGDLGGGSVTSVALTAPTGLTVSGSPITTSGTLALALDTGYVIPTQSTLDTFVTMTGVETLTNKTLTSAVLTNPIMSGNTVFSDDSSAHDFDIGSHNGTNGLKLGGTLVSATAAELNLLDGVSAGTVTNSKAVIYGSGGELAVGDGKLTINSTAVTATAAELNVLDGISSTLTSAELDILDGALLSTSELNILNGVTATTAELNKIDGYLGTATELNYAKDLYDTGVTATEYDYLDGVTSNIQSQLNSKLETETTTSISITNQGGDPRNIAYVDEEGTTTTLDLQALVRAQETVTSLAFAANTLTYTDEDGNDTDIDLSIYVDDTNLARITSGSVNDAGIATFSRDDGTTFDISFAGLFDGYGLTVVGDDSSGHKFLSGNTLSVSGATGISTSVDNNTGELTITGPDLTSYVTLTGTQTLTNKTLTSANINTQLLFPDSAELRLGTGSDVKIDYDGTDFITNVTAGDTKLELGGDFTITNNAGTTTYFNIDADGETSLRHNGSEKLNTASGGVEVTGDITIDASKIIAAKSNTGTTATIDFTGMAAEISIAVEDVADATKRQINKILVTHDGTDVYITEYGATFSDSDLISSITGAESGGTVTVTVTTTASSKVRLNAIAFA